jgi:hypothetical protein
VKFVFVAHLLLINSPKLKEAGSHNFIAIAKRPVYITGVAFAFLWNRGELMKRQCLVLCAVMTIVVACPLPVIAQTSYLFKKIADMSGPLSFFQPEVAINDKGTVAFSANLDAGGSGVFTGDGGVATTIADASGAYASFVPPRLDINNSGVVAFTANLDAGGTGVYTSAGGATTTIATIGVGSFSGVGLPAINDSGVVSFRGGKLPTTAGIYRGDGGAITTIIETSLSSFLGLHSSINDNGTVAFQSSAGIVAGVYTGVGGLSTTIADSSGQLDSFSDPAINISGQAAFRALSDSGGRGIYVSDGGPSAKIADDGGVFSDFSPRTAINDSGKVIFQATFDSDGSRGLYTGADPVADKVIHEGDALFGSTLTQLFDAHDVNDGGTIAFRYLLANGVAGVAVATAVPEPTGAVMSAMIAAVLLARCPNPSPRPSLRRRRDARAHGAVSAPYVSGRRSL